MEGDHLSFMGRFLRQVAQKQTLPTWVRIRANPPAVVRMLAGGMFKLVLLSLSVTRVGQQVSPQVFEGASAFWVLLINVDDTFPESDGVNVSLEFEIPEDGRELFAAAVYGNAAPRRMRVIPHTPDMASNRF